MKPSQRKLLTIERRSLKELILVIYLVLIESGHFENMHVIKIYVNFVIFLPFSYN